MKKTHRNVIPENVSPGVRALNPHLFGGQPTPAPQMEPQGTTEQPQDAPKPRGMHRRKRMNKTEATFARILDAQKARGEVLRWEFEGLAFRWGGTPDNPPVLFSPDFAVFTPGGLKLIEVKGAHIFPKALVTFKGARSEWPEFKWEVHQLKRGEWTRIQ